MTPPLSEALEVSRRTPPNAASLPRIFSAEGIIGGMNDPAWQALQRQLAEVPGDGFLWLWNGLVLAQRGEFEPACHHFAEAIERGCSHWRVGWYIAQAARKLGQLELVDSACAAVLKANPEFWYAREFPKHARGYYSQLGQDKLLEDFFQSHPPRTRRFVEVGAFDGVHYSNVRRFHEAHGWSGLCVEPVSKNFAKLSASYQGSDVRCVQAAVSSEEGQLDIHVSHYPHLPDWGSDVASIGGADKERWSKRYGAQWTIEKVAARRLTDLVDEAGFDDFDLLSIDAEGHDLEVLASLDLERFQPQAIVIEFGTRKAEVLRFLEEHGFSLLKDNGQDLIAVRPQAVRCACGVSGDVRRSASSPVPRLETIDPSRHARILKTLSCRDCDPVPKVPEAGQVLEGSPRLQVMHNGLRIVAGAYHGDWMTEIIRCLRGHHEPQEEWVFHRVLETLPPDAVMIEAGSYWAYYSMWFLKAVPTGRSHLIEPNPAKLETGRRHFALNGLQGTFVRGFIGACSSEQAEFVDWDGTRMAMPRIAIDDYLDREGVPFLHVLHADIQGAETALLEGCRRSLKAGRIGYLVLSTHGRQHQICLQMLHDAGCHIVASHTPGQSASEDGLLVAATPSVARPLTVGISRVGEPAEPGLEAAAQPPPEGAGNGVVSPERLPELLQRLNPHLLELKTLPLDRPVQRVDLASAGLLTERRFDLAAKLLYARHRHLGVESVWATHVYEEHVRAFSMGSCCEGDGVKSGIENYLTAFHAVLDSVKQSGLNPAVSLVPVDRHHTPIDGAHRVAAAMDAGSPVPALVFDFKANRYDARFFRKRGLPEPVLDAMALEFAQGCPDAHFLHLFPTAAGRDDEVRAILEEHGSIVYEKSIRLTGEGPVLLVRELYASEPWIGTWANDFAGARKDASVRFQGMEALRVFLFRCDDLAKAKAAKETVRALYGQGNYSCHVNDSHEETVRLARIYFHAGSLHFLNHARPRYLQRFHRHLELYRAWLKSVGAEPEQFCVDGSATMAAYGLRDAQDLDVLHWQHVDFSTAPQGINSHNPDAHHHVVPPDQILFHPDHHFYYSGLKFVALSGLRAMKANRAEGKDLADIALIDSLERPQDEPTMRAIDVLAKNVSREALRIYYVPNGDDYHIAALLDRLYTTVRPFGCRDVKDYIERRILAYKTPDAGTRLWDEVVAMVPDVVYVESARNIDPSVLQRIRTELGIPVTMWFGDACVNDEFIQRILSYAPSVTHQVTVDRKVALAARKQGLTNVEFIPFFGYDHYFRPLPVAKSIEILFSGKSYHRSLKRYPFAAERLAFVQRVNREFGSRLRVVGEDWESFGLANVHHGRVPEWDVNRLNNESRIVLAYDAAHVDGFTSCRTYHALLGRSFVLLRKFPGVERLFINGEHLVWFESEQEGIELLHHYLAHPEECERIAASGYQHVRGNGWMFSSVIRHLVRRGLGCHTRSFEETFATYSKPLPQSLLQSPPPTRGKAAPEVHASAPPPAPASAPAPRSKPTPRRSAVEECLQHADRFFQEGNLAQARQWLERVLDLEPQVVEIWVASGNLALQLGDIPAAVTALEKAVGLRPNDAAIQTALAAAYVRADRIEDFEKALGTALQLNPGEPSAVRLLADLNFQQGQYVEAARGYHHLAQLNPTDLSILLPLGFCFAKAGDKGTACAVYQEILRIDPANALARENLGALGVEVSPPVPPQEVSSVPGAATTARDGAPAPLVTAIVSTYKSERYLRGCLEDLLKQTLADRLEIVVIDSGSPENERAIVEEFQGRHPRIRYLRTERETIYAAWNRAVQLASAPYLTSANADDRHRPEALERLVRELEAHPECGVAYADCAVCETVHPDFGYPELRGYYRWPEHDPVLLFRGCYLGPQPVWRRSLHERYGLFDAAYRSAGDYEFWLRIVRWERFRHLPEVLGLHWYAEASLGHQNRELTREESDRARARHWPAEWGRRPTEPFRTLQPIPAIEKHRQRHTELASNVQRLEKEVVRLEGELARLRTPAASLRSDVDTNGSSNASTGMPSGVPEAKAAPIPASDATLSPGSQPGATVPPSAVLPTDTNLGAFQHLLAGFDRLREDRFEEAQIEARHYQRQVDYKALPKVDHRPEGVPLLSVVVVAHQTRQDLLACLDSLSSPDAPTYEVIVVDNGGNESVEAELHRRPLLHVRPPVNVLPAEGRNIGVHFARASLVVFVDDDAVVGPGYLASVLAGFEAFEIEALRGKVLPKTEHENNRKVRHYDLGDTPLVADANTEGNSAFRVEAWRRVGGQDPLLFGGEGLEISFRIHGEYGPGSILYWPPSVIHHDYAGDDAKLDRKRDRHQAVRAYLEWKHPGILECHARVKLAPITEDERYQRTLPLRPRRSKPPEEETASPPTPPAAARPAPVVVPSPLAALRSALSRRGWMLKFDSYAAKFKGLEYAPGDLDPKISVVLIAHELRVDSIKVLRKLDEERDGTFEVIYVLNGSDALEAEKVRPYVDTLVELTENTGAYFARNVGAVFAKASILFFLDDDAIPERGVVAAHLDEFRRFDVIAVRGAILPKTENRLNELAKHYHLGPRRFPIHADIEGNTSYLAESFFAVGGWDDEIVFGGGGIDLAFRLLRVDGDRRKQIYSPVPVVYHDYAANEEHLARKAKKQAESRERLYRKHPHFESLRNGWRSFLGKEHLVPVRTPEGTAPGAVSCGSRPAWVTATAGEVHPLITIAIPTFNRAQYLREAVRSALDQTYPHLEVVIVDDGSTDDTALVLKEFNDPRIRTFTKAHSGGPATRNRCVAEARGDYIVWLDSDDVLLADTVSLYVAELGRDPSLEVIYGNLLVADEKLQVQELWSYEDYHGWPEALLAECTIENRIPNVGTLVRRTCYDRFGLYNDAFPRAHDYEFWTRLASVANVRSIQTEVAIYRRHEDSLTKLSKPADTRYEANAVKHLLTKHPLRNLFPLCYPAGALESHGDARAWSIASLLMVKYGDVATALVYARRSVEAAALGQNEDLLRILEAVEGRIAPPQSKARSSDEFGQLVETAKRHYAAGHVQPCAKACARLSEIRPAAPETLLLTALSLRRWAGAADAQTAFQVLVRRQCSEAYIDATAEAEALRTADDAQLGPEETMEGSVLRTTARAFAERIAPFFGSEILPLEAIRRTLTFITAAASAPEPRSYLSSHLQGQTPVFFAMLGCAEEVLTDDPADSGLREAFDRVRQGLEATRSGSTPRKPGYSFCIITGGTRPEKVARQIESIHALGLDNYEIWVGGEVSQVSDTVRRVDLAGAAKSGRLGRMRNVLARMANFDHVVVSDDDIVFDPGFAAGLKRFGEAYELMAVRILNTDGSRFWDWATTGGLRGSVLLDYWESDPHVYVTGGFCVLKTEVIERVQWDDLRGFYQHEDVDFSTRAKAAGIEIRFNPFCTVVHDDDSYSRVGRMIYRFDNLIHDLVDQGHSRSREELERMLQAAFRIAGTHLERRSIAEETARKLGLPIPPSATVSSKPAPSLGARGSSGSASDASTVPSQSSKTEQPSPVATAVAPMTGQIPSPLAVDWVGSFLDHGSLSQVNRELVRALERSAGMSVQAIGPAQPAAMSGSPIPWRLSRPIAAKASKDARVTVRHAWPPNWDRPRTGALVVIQPWEYGSLPKAWVRDLAQVDEVWVPSSHVRDVYREAGIAPEKIAVVPNGIDPERFHPGVSPRPLATRKRFKFLFVGGTIHRKGPDVLLAAYLERFKASDDVCLVIKDFGGQSVYAGQTMGEAIRAAQARPNAPEILYLNEEWSPDELPGLYTACDCLVHPYRGEGFGLPVLEAMACGLPVVVTAGGGADDFATDAFAYRIPARRKEIGNRVGDIALCGSGWLLEPDTKALSERLGWVFSHPEEARARGRAASQHVLEHWTWTQAARVATDRLRQLAQRIPGRGQRPPAKASAPIRLPACARVGHLGPVQELISKKKLREAWQATLEALRQRPFHPEAYLVLAEIAKVAGDSSAARRCAQHARTLVPEWRPAKQFLKANLKGNSHPEWLQLPPALLGSDTASRPTLSVCLIVKDEEQFLARCLDSVRSIAHQVVVLDTGSTDRTVAIAKERGAEVHSFTWCDDFSAARNAALEHATGDWVLMIDADEELPADQHAKLFEDVRKAKVLGFRMPLLNVGAEADGLAYVPRLYRNAPGLFYVSRIHEQVFSSILVRAEEWGLETALGTAQLRHYGYSTELVRDRRKVERNLGLLREAVDEFPEDANLHMNLGLELIHSGDLDGGLAEYEKAFEALSADPDQQRVPELRETLLTQYASHLMKACRYADIVRVLQSPVASAHEATASLHFALGLAFLRLDRSDAAAREMKLCLAKRHLPTVSPINPEIRRAGPYHCLALCLARVGQVQEAENAFIAGLRDEPSSRAVRIDLARLYRNQKRPLDAIRTLHELIDRGRADVEVWRLGGEIALEEGSLIEFAVDWTGEAVRHHPREPVLEGQHGEALLLSGNAAAAVPRFKASAESGELAHRAALCLCEVAEGVRPTPIPRDQEQAVATHFLRWFQRLAASTRNGILRPVLDNLHVLEQVLPSAARALRAAVSEVA